MCCSFLSLWLISKRKTWTTEVHSKQGDILAVLSKKLGNFVYIIFSLSLSNFFFLSLSLNTHLKSSVLWVTFTVSWHLCVWRGSSCLLQKWGLNRTSPIQALLLQTSGHTLHFKHIQFWTVSFKSLGLLSSLWGSTSTSACKSSALSCTLSWCSFPVSSGLKGVLHIGNL